MKSTTLYSVTKADWTTADVTFLRKHAHLGVAEVSRLMGRSVGSVKEAARRHRISLRRRGERRGILLGQPRHFRLRELLPAEVDRETAALILTRQQLDEEAELCPSCGYRLATVRQTGLCLPCHKRRLAEAHREIAAELEATRDHWQAKQQSKRARDRAGVG